MKLAFCLALLTLLVGCSSNSISHSSRKSKSGNDKKPTLVKQGPDPVRAFEEAAFWKPLSPPAADESPLRNAERSFTQSNNEMSTRLALAEVQTRYQKWPQVVETLRPSAEILDRRGLLLLAKAYGYQNNNLAAIRVIDILRGKYPTDYYADFVLAETYLRLANDRNTDASQRKSHRERALQAYHDAREKNRDFLPSYEGSLRLIEISPENNSEAINLIQDMIKKFGQSARAMQRLCHAYVEAGYVAKAIQVCQEAVSLSPNDPEVPLDLARAYKAHQENERGDALVLENAKKFPASESAQLAAADQNLNAKNYAGAIAYYEAAKKINSKNAEAWLGAARCLVELTRFSEALVNYREACALKAKYITEFKRGSGRVRSLGAVEMSSRFEESYGMCGSKEKAF